MTAQDLKDILVERFAIIRILYGLKLFLRDGSTPVSKWFLTNRTHWNHETKLIEGGVILDVGAFKGTFTQRLIKTYPELNFFLFEPIPRSYEYLKDRFHALENVKVFRQAISADGRKLIMVDAGLRSRQTSILEGQSVLVDSLSICEIIASHSNIELLKLNIEGMEYECLEEMILKDFLRHVRFFLIQFHDFSEDSAIRRKQIQEELKKDFTCVYNYEWLWELWQRNY